MKSKLILLVLAILFSCVDSIAQLQNGVRQQGTITVNHCTQWAGNNLIKDSGSACGGGGGSPASPTLTLQFNNGGSFGSVTGTSYSGGILSGFPQFSQSLTNSNVATDPNYHRAIDLTFTTNSADNLNPGFTDQGGLFMTYTGNHGQYSYAGGTNAKTTFLPNNIFTFYTAQGQRFIYGGRIECYGIGDCGFHGNDYVQHAGYAIQGDEGNGWGLVSLLTTQPHLNLYTVTAVPTPTTCNTTLTQNVTFNATAQSVTVASNTGCSVNDWVIIGQAVPIAQPNISAVKITAVAAGHISGVFANNYSSGATVTPPKIVTLDSVSELGEGRFLMNLSGTTDTTGTVMSISGGGFVGTGTNWANNMVGGTATNIGCIYLTADDYSSEPFNGSGNIGTLHAPYAISSVTNTTHLGIFRTDDSLNGAYSGKGPGSGGYTIKPCARILAIDGSNAILESTSTTWSVSDSVEQTISINSTAVQGFKFQMSDYQPGGTYRGFMDVDNVGARTYDAGFTLSANLRSGADVDTVAWDVGYSCSSCNTFLSATQPVTTALKINTNSSHQGIVQWDPANMQMGLDTTSWYMDPFRRKGSQSDGVLRITDGSLPLYTFNANAALKDPDTGNPPSLTFTNNNNFYTRMTSYMSTGGSPATGGRSLDVIANIGSDIPVMSFGGFHSESMNGGAYGVGNTPFSTATSNTTNGSSTFYSWVSSVWDGAAAQQRYFYASTNPEQGSNNAHNTWTLKAQSGTAQCNTFNTAFPCLVFSVRDDGVMSFGRNQNSNTLAVLDPTGLTATRTLTIPDIAGAVAVTTGAVNTANAPACFNGSGQIFKGTNTAGVLSCP